MDKTVSFGNLSAGAGQIVREWLQVPGVSFSIPATLICGRTDGPTVLVSGGIHSCEYVGIQAAVALSQQLTPQEIHGALLLLHPVNPVGFQARTASLVPTDGRNLNREFPGSEQGSESQRLAHFFVTEIYPKLDFYLDLHGGEIFENLSPYVYFGAAGSKEVEERAKKAAQCINVPYMVRSLAKTGAYNYAGIMGVPSLLLERGCAGTWTPQEVEEDIQDVRRVLAQLGMLDHAPRQSQVPKLVTEVLYQKPNTPGLWYPQVQAGDFVRYGQPIGVVRDYWGKELERYTAPYNGVVLYLTRTLWADDFIELFTIAKLEK